MTGQTNLGDTFAAHQLEPYTVLDTLDADVRNYRRTQTRKLEPNSFLNTSVSVMINHCNNTTY